MPELPEVETTVRDLKKKVPGRTFIDVWTDFQKMIKKPKDFKDFKKEIKGRKIENIRRRGKNILIDLSGRHPPATRKTLLIHQKLTGHLLIGNWKLDTTHPPSLGNWKPLKTGPLQEKINTYIHLMFWLSGNLMLALSDLRKFAKVELLNKEDLKKELSSLGLEPLDKSFTFEKFKKALLKRRKGKIKQVLMDQTVIAGIGNIYSDEILWRAKIHPFKDVSKLTEEELKKIYQAMKKILGKAIEVKGESISDFRRISGEKGGFDPLRKVYRKEGEKCNRCGTIIKRVKLAGRSAHFCPSCQRL